jgi:ribonuclease P protein component
MRREQRLTRRRDFGAVYRHGRSYRGALLSIRVRPSTESASRFGFAVRAALGKATVRNRLKRRLRAAAADLTTPAGWDIVVSGRPSAGTASYADLRSELERLLSEAGVLPEPDSR